AAAGYHIAQRCKAHAAHEHFGLGEIEGEGDRILDAVLHGPSQVDEIAVSGEEEWLFGGCVLLEPGACSSGRGVGRGSPPGDGTLAAGYARSSGFALTVREAELDTLDALLLDDPMRLERPREPAV